MFKEEWDNWSKMDKAGYIIGNLLLVVFMIGILYWSFFTDELLKLAYSNIFYFVLIMLGILYFYEIYENIIELIFFPETINERNIRKKRKEYKKIYPIELAKIKLEQFKIKLKLKDINEKIKKESANTVHLFTKKEKAK